MMEVAVKESGWTAVKWLKRCRSSLSRVDLIKLAYVCDVFFASRRRHTRFDCDWSSDVCSSDLVKEINMGSTQPLQGRIALVTGVGRRAGIGAAICLEIAKNGGDVFFTYWHQYDKHKETHSEKSENDPAAMAAELSQFGVRVGSVEIDLSVPDSAEKLFQSVENELGRPAILINNACHDFEVPFLELSPEILDKHYAVNVRAVAIDRKSVV